jgi:hypothetical protein
MSSNSPNAADIVRTRINPFRNLILSVKLILKTNLQRRKSNKKLAWKKNAGKSTPSLVYP